LRCDQQSEQTKEERRRRMSSGGGIALAQRNPTQSAHLVTQQSLLPHRLPPLQNATVNSHKRAEGRVAGSADRAEDLEPISWPTSIIIVMSLSIAPAVEGVNNT